VSVIGITSIALGILIICLRAPLLVAPAATLRRVHLLIATNATIRILGGIVLIVGALMVWAGTTGYGTLATVLTIWGWAMIGVALVTLLLFPNLYRGLVRALIPDPVGGSLPGWRLVGLIGAGVGLLMIYVGIRAL
jgi:hypothetical protein